MKKNIPFVTAVIAAAGQGTRMGYDKLFADLNGLPVVLYSLIALEMADYISEIVVVSRQEDILAYWDLAKNHNIKKLKMVTTGSTTRQRSVFEGVKQANPVCEYIAIHDGARPLITSDAINTVVKDAISYGAAALGVAVKDTLKICDDKGFVALTPDRSSLRAIQTPQVFRADSYRHAMAIAQQENLDFTDDCQLIENIGQKVYISSGDYTNIKITTPEDLIYASAFLQGGYMKIL